MKKTAIYIHIPFCDHKCIYCDFYSLVGSDNQKEYLDALKTEIIYYSQIYSEKRVIDTIFFGGGTPSLMEPSYIGKILKTINDNFVVSAKAEITLETNPGTVDKTKLQEFRKVGINRISIGIQTFNESELKFLTRIHNKNTAIKIVEDAYGVGFENISIDLIFSIPNQSQEIWKKNLDIATNLPIKHISTYSLILEEGTMLNKMVLDGKVTMNDENFDANLYKYTMDFLSDKNFIQYEISNFCKYGFECKHNQYYWKYYDYLGFGTSSHSFVNGKRWWNFSNLKKYISKINKSGYAQRGEEILDKYQILDEFIMLGLRSDGIDLERLKYYSKEWYIKKKNLIDSFKKNGYLQIENGKISCTKKGYLICDELVNKLLIE